MAHRQPSDTERAVLAHRTVNPDGWRNHIRLTFMRAQSASQHAERLARLILKEADPMGTIEDAAVPAKHAAWAEKGRTSWLRKM